MTYNISDITRDVRVILDQNSISEQLLKIEDSDTLRLNELIRSKIEDATRFVISSAQSYLLGAGIPYEASVAWKTAKGIGSGYILLPDDFLRLVTFQMSDWSYPVSKVITEDSKLYARQQSRFSGVKGNPQKPVVALVNHPAGLILEFYSCKEGESCYVKSMRYLPLPKIEQGDCGETIEIPNKLYDAAKYHTAYLTAASLEMSAAATLAEITKTYLQ